jgi:methylmalonyl-CoA mutase C-terminal domain/subunit
LLIGGGIIPHEDVGPLEGEGVAKVFGPGTATPEIVAYITEWVASHGS